LESTDLTSSTSNLRCQLDSMMRHACIVSIRCRRCPYQLDEVTLKIASQKSAEEEEGQNTVKCRAREPCVETRVSHDRRVTRTRIIVMFPESTRGRIIFADYTACRHHPCCPSIAGRTPPPRRIGDHFSYPVGCSACLTFRIGKTAGRPRAPGGSPWLELYPQREHHLPLHCSPAKCGVDYRPAARAIDASLRIIQVHLIEEVEDVGTKLQGNAFP
jgi:hypothetical protein